jgi:hypothetical protein
MKNIIDFILESQGQRPRFRKHNRPYKTEKDKLVVDSKYKDYKKLIFRLEKFTTELEKGLGKYANRVELLLFPEDYYFRFNNDDYKKDNLVKFTNDYGNGSNYTFYNMFNITDWYKTFDYVEGAHHGSILANDIEIDGHKGKMVMNKEKLSFDGYHTNEYDKNIYGLRIYIHKPDNRTDKYGDVEWDVNKIIRNIYNRLHKGHSKDDLLSISDLGKGNYTGENVAKAIVDALENW